MVIMASKQFAIIGINHADGAKDTAICRPVETAETSARLMREAGYSVIIKPIQSTSDAEASLIKRTRHIYPLEPVMDCGLRGRWEYCSLRDHNAHPMTQRYLHVDCDSLTDQDGNCIMCKAPSPASNRW